MDTAYNTIRILETKKILDDKYFKILSELNFVVKVEKTTTD